jgi:hypothetical protein
MRQLWATGWMHNRVRMIAASFLVKHLLIDWRRGTDWFWDTLVDADYGNNGQNWQWIAGTGVDSQPFNRIMAPLVQSRKFERRPTISAAGCRSLRGLATISSTSRAARGPRAIPEPIVGHRAGAGAGRRCGSPDTRYSPDDVRYMQDMIHHHQQAVEMAALVKGRTTRQELLDVAERIDASQADEMKFMQTGCASAARPPNPARRRPRAGMAPTGGPPRGGHAGHGDARADGGARRRDRPRLRAAVPRADDRPPRRRGHHGGGAAEAARLGLRSRCCSAFTTT